jgi:hypothetical protein
MAKSRDNFPISPDVLDWFRNVFAAANAKVSNKIARVPNAPEESLDMTLIEHLSGYGVPHLLQSGWTVRIDAHFLADCGIFTENGKSQTSACSSTTVVMEN